MKNDLKKDQYRVREKPLSVRAAVVCACRAKLGHGLLSGQYSKPPMKSELIEQVMNEEHKVLNWVGSAPMLGPYPAKAWENMATNTHLLIKK